MGRGRVDGSVGSDVAPQANSQLLRRGIISPVAAADHFCYREISRIIRKTDHLRYRFTRRLETLMNIPKRTSPAKLAEMKPSCAKSF